MSATLRLLLAGLACCLALPALAAFTDHGDGTITDTVTGLMWDKCSWGQSNTGTCAGGAASVHTWSAALGVAVTANTGSHRGYSDWRLPTKNELESLLKIDASNPATDTVAFPATASHWYWTSTTSAPNPANAWCVRFDDGGTLADIKSGTYYVRLVRSGQSFDSFDSMDTTPDAFSFTAQTGVATNTAIQSNTITLSGLTTVTNISISGGQYKINGGSYTSAPGTASNGDQITLQLTSSASASTLATATLTVGGVSGAFNVTTADDTTPDAFDIPNLTNQALATVVTTNAITVAGLNTSVTAATTVGTLVKNGTDTGSSSATVVNGNTVAIRLTTSASPSTAINGTLTIGTGFTASDTFSVTTVAATNGVCGAANGAASTFTPTSGLCAAGSASAVSNASSWTWSCVGVNSGTTSLCSAPTVTTATNSGNARATVSGGTWTVNGAASSGFIATSGHAKSPPSLPAGYSFPHGLLDFTLNAGAAGSTATLVITYPSPLPAGTVYWKYGPSPAGYNCTGAACAAPHWYQMPPAQAVVAGNTITLTIVDGGVGDDDLAANGSIVDAGGPGVPAGVANIPTLSEWGLLLLSLLLGGWVFVSPPNAAPLSCRSRQG